MDKTKEAIVQTTQTIEAYKKQGHKVLGAESMTPRKIGGVQGEADTWYLKIPYPRGTERIAVIYFD